MRERIVSTWRTLRLSRLAFLFESRIAVIGIAMVLFWILVAIFAPPLAPYDPNAIVGRLSQPPSAEHWMGTDNLGRDVLSRLIYGSRPILVLAPISVLLSVAIGVTLGLLSGYLGGVVDEVLMRVLDAVMAFPTILLYMIIIAAVGASKINVIMAITIGGVPGITRIVRSLVLDVRSREFVQAARLRGESILHIMFREILPNCLGPIVVDSCLRIGYAAFAIGGLGFLGLGLPPPDPDWGRMVSDGRVWIMTAPWIVIFPSLAIATLVVGLNLFADGLNEATQRV
ncbi:MAG: ABC transporter permease [Anaerolineae bacterium]|nr:ABC transporter permease [Anaerolineae bacterium]